MSGVWSHWNIFQKIRVFMCESDYICLLEMTPITLGYYYSLFLGRLLCRAQTTRFTHTYHQYKDIFAV